MEYGPPSSPRDTPYTRCYCEENVYMLAQRFGADTALSATWDLLVLFISNHDKTVALWKQKAGVTSGPVVWDYHVVLILRSKTNLEIESSAHGQLENEQSWVYDADSSLPLPCDARLYFSATFLPCAPRYESVFRIIPAHEYLDNFASDRSHMLVTHTPLTLNDLTVGRRTESLEHTEKESQLVYCSPIPLYPPICGPVALKRGVQHNLMESFVDMSTPGFGYVMTLDRLVDMLDVMHTVERRA